MLTLTKKTEYALIAACHLAHVENEVISARDLSEIYDIRLPLLMNVLKLLGQAGIVKSARGPRGGYSMGRKASLVTLSDLIGAVEGPARLVKCALPQLDDPKCELSGRCPVRLPLGKIHRRFSDFLKSVTIEDLAMDDAYRGVVPKVCKATASK